MLSSGDKWEPLRVKSVDIYNQGMKITRLLPALLLLAYAVSACTPRAEWAQHAVNDKGFPPYTFEYPSSWWLEEGNNFSSMVSKKKLLEDAPEKLEPGQVIVGLTLNINMSPEEMVQYRIDSLTGFIRFEEVVPTTLNERPAAMAVGIQPDSEDQTLLIAVDLGQNNRALLSSRIAAGELETWRETLYHIVNSITFQE